MGLGKDLYVVGPLLTVDKLGGMSECLIGVYNELLYWE